MVELSIRTEHCILAQDDLQHGHWKMKHLCIPTLRYIKYPLPAGGDMESTETCVNAVDLQPSTHARSVSVHVAHSSHNTATCCRQQQRRRSFLQATVWRFHREKPSSIVLGYHRCELHAPFTAAFMLHLIVRATGGVETARHLRGRHLELLCCVKTLSC